MKKVSYGIRWQPWVFEAVKAYAQKNGMDFSATVNFFVENELNHYGYFRKDYQPGIVDERIMDNEQIDDTAFSKRRAEPPNNSI